MDRATIRPFQLYPAAYDPHTLYPVSYTHLCRPNRIQFRCPAILLMAINNRIIQKFHIIK